MNNSVEIKLPPDLTAATEKMVAVAIDSAIKEAQKKNAYPAYMNKGTAANYIGVSPNTFNDWIKRYNIPSVHIEGVQRFRRIALDEFMKKMEK